MAAKPWMTTMGLIESVKRKISMPLEQGTYNLGDVIATLNEEMQISQVPSIMEFSEEYFVYKVSVPLISNKVRYDIPDRAIGMKVRDIFIEDSSGNLSETTRISPDAKAYWGGDSTARTSGYIYYIQGNQVIFTGIDSVTEGNLVFDIFLRPNQLVLDSRAAIAQSFIKRIVVQTNPSPGDTLTINGVEYVAAVSASAPNEFTIGLTTTATASNIASLLMVGSVSNVIKYVSKTSDINIVSSSPNIEIDTEIGVKFDQVLTEWQNPDTLENEALFEIGALVDFLQTRPGHRTYNFDYEIKNIEGNEMYFESIPSDFIVGDYVCLANECIIPQIPPDLHNGLAERAGARILASIGDQAGLQVSMGKISEIDQRQSTLLNNRVTGAPMKVGNRGSILKANKRWGRRIY